MSLLRCRGVSSHPIEQDRKSFDGMSSNSQESLRQVFEFLQLE